MIRTSRTALCALLVALAAGACAPRAAGVSPTPATWSADEAQIRAALGASTEAWNRGDLKGHLALYVDSVTFMTGNGPRPGVRPIEESFTRTFFRDGQPKQQLRFEQVAVRPLGPGAALATGRFILSGGGEADKTGWWTLVWMRTPDGWRAVHDHSS